MFKISLVDPVPVTENITVSFTGSGSAINPTDYTLLGLTGGSIVIPAGITEVTVSVDASNDGIIEGPETVGIQLTSAASASQPYTIDPARSSAEVVIVDANAASSTPIQVITGTNGSEPANQAQCTIKLAGVATSAWPVSIGYRLTGTASPGVDYQSTGSITIPANTNSVTVLILVTDDHIIEPVENLTITLLSGSATDGGGNAFIFPPDPANNDVSINIAEDDDMLAANRTLSIVPAADGAEPSSNGAFTVSLPSDYRSSGSMPILFSIAGTADLNSDYTMVPATLPAYYNTYTIPVTTIDDTLAETTETVTLNLQNTTDANTTPFNVSATNGSATMNITDNDVPLPLRLLSFSGNIEPNGNARLTWYTADEENTGHFEILHSDDGLRFDPVGYVPAKGYGNNQYTFTCSQPAGLSYYRLHMVDRDGQGTYSNTITIKKNLDAAQPASLYPNPAKRQVMLNVGNENLLHTKATITDISGRVCETISIKNHTQLIPLDRYTAGTYFLKMEDGTVLKLMVK